MGQLKLNIAFSKNEGLIMSPSDLVELYLSGIPLCYADGRQMDYNTLKQKIFTAQRQVENSFSIKLIKQVIDNDSRDFIMEEFRQWGHIKVTYPINEPLGLDGMVNNIRQVRYPKEWLSIKRDSSKESVSRNLFLIPNTSGGAQMSQNSFIFSGITPHMGFFGAGYIPNYWRCKYCTGWNKTPEDLFDFVGKLAAIQILAQLGDILLGVGISSNTLTIDGLTQTISTTKSAQGGLFAGRIKHYTDEMVGMFDALKYEYKGITFQVL